MTPVTLASQSAVRATLLRSAGMVVATVSSGVDEDAVKQRLAKTGPLGIAQVLADEKALAVSKDREGLVIGADQTLELDGALFDKAADLDGARERLVQLRGKTHQLHSAVSLARDGEVVWRTLSTARLTMRPFTDSFLTAYLAGNEGVLSSVGCYQLEGEGAQLFERIEGDYFSILGLPLIPLLDALRREGALGA